MAHWHRVLSLNRIRTYVPNSPMIQVCKFPIGCGEDRLAGLCTRHDLILDHDRSRVLLSNLIEPYPTLQGSTVQVSLDQRGFVGV